MVHTGSVLYAVEFSYLITGTSITSMQSLHTGDTGFANREHLKRFHLAEAGLKAHHLTAIHTTSRQAHDAEQGGPDAGLYTIQRYAPFF